jgi:hypothetical protein
MEGSHCRAPVARPGSSTHAGLRLCNGRQAQSHQRNASQRYPDRRCHENPPSIRYFTRKWYQATYADHSNVRYPATAVLVALVGHSDFDPKRAYCESLPPSRSQHDQGLKGAKSDAGIIATRCTQRNRYYCHLAACSFGTRMSRPQSLEPYARMFSSRFACEDLLV